MLHELNSVGTTRFMFLLLPLHKAKICSRGSVNPPEQFLRVHSVLEGTGEEQEVPFCTQKSTVPEKLKNWVPPIKNKFPFTRSLKSQHKGFPHTFLQGANHLPDFLFVRSPQKSPGIQPIKGKHETCYLHDGLASIWVDAEGTYLDHFLGIYLRYFPLQLIHQCPAC